MQPSENVKKYLNTYDLYDYLYLCRSAINIQNWEDGKENKNYSFSYLLTNFAQYYGDVGLNSKLEYLIALNDYLEYYTYNNIGSLSFCFEDVVLLRKEYEDLYKNYVNGKDKHTLFYYSLAWEHHMTKVSNDFEEWFNQKYKPVVESMY